MKWNSDEHRGRRQIGFLMQTAAQWPLCHHMPACGTDASGTVCAMGVTGSSQSSQAPCSPGFVARRREGEKLSEQLYGMFFGGEYPPLHQATSQHIHVWSVCPVHHQAGNPGAAQISPQAPSEPLREGGASWLWARLANRSEKLKKKRLEAYKLEECEKKWRKCISQIVSRP